MSSTDEGFVEINMLLLLHQKHGVKAIAGELEALDHLFLYGMQLIRPKRRVVVKRQIRVLYSRTMKLHVELKSFQG